MMGWLLGFPPCECELDQIENLSILNQLRSHKFSGVLTGVQLTLIWDSYVFWYKA